MAAKKETVVLRFPLIAEILENKLAVTVQVEQQAVRGKHYPVATVFGKDDEEIEIPFIYFGRNVEFEKSDEGYDISPKNKNLLEDIFLGYEKSELEFLHNLVTVVKGSIIEEPISIQGDELEYDEISEKFTCGCKTIDLKKADKIFRYLGRILGYEIT